MPGNPAFELLDRCEQNAEATLGDARKLFDLSQEKPELRDRYGRTQFGQSCLMARRLVERGVPYITINYGGWDDHDRSSKNCGCGCPTSTRACPRCCRTSPTAACSTARSSGAAASSGARPRWTGTRPGTAAGTTGATASPSSSPAADSRAAASSARPTPKASTSAERPVYPPDLLGSICELLGIDPDGPLPNSRELKLQVMPLWTDGGGKDRSAERDHELMSTLQLDTTVEVSARP